VSGTSFVGLDLEASCAVKLIGDDACFGWQPANVTRTPVTMTPNSAPRFDASAYSQSVAR
jgi:hypothetical protein